MRYEVIISEQAKNEKKINLDKRLFNSLLQAIEFIKGDVIRFKQYAGDIIIQRDDGAGVYKAIYCNKYKHIRVIRWHIVEA